MNLLKYFPYFFTKALKDKTSCGQLNLNYFLTVPNISDVNKPSVMYVQWVTPLKSLFVQQRNRNYMRYGLMATVSRLYSLPTCDAVQFCRSSSTFRKNLLPVLQT